jgi:hypothetical protein
VQKKARQAPSQRHMLGERLPLACRESVAPACCIRLHD